MNPKYYVTSSGAIYTFAGYKPTPEEVAEVTRQADTVKKAHRARVAEQKAAEEARLKTEQPKQRNKIEHASERDEE